MTEPVVRQLRRAVDDAGILGWAAASLMTYGPLSGVWRDTIVVERRSA